MPRVYKRIVYTLSRTYIRGLPKVCATGRSITMFLSIFSKLYTFDFKTIITKVIYYIFMKYNYLFLLFSSPRGFLKLSFLVLTNGNCTYLLLPLTRYSEKRLQYKRISISKLEFFILDQYSSRALYYHPV